MFAFGETDLLIDATTRPFFVMVGWEESRLLHAEFSIDRLNCGLVLGQRVLFCDHGHLLAFVGVSHRPYHEEFV